MRSATSRLLTGQIGRAGASPFSITGQCNAMGTREAGFTSVAARLSQVRRSRGTAPNSRSSGTSTKPRFPTKRGLAYPDIVEAAVGRHASARCGSSRRIRSSRSPIRTCCGRGSANLDFLVVQDGYHPTPTTELADLVFPAAIWGEKEGTYTNSERRVSKVNKAVEPPGEARSDFDIFLAVAEKLGCRERAVSRLERQSKTPSTNGGESPRAASATTPASAMNCSPKRGAVQWPFPEGAEPAPTTRLYSDGSFKPPDGRAKLVCAEWEPFPEQPNRSIHSS